MKKEGLLSEPQPIQDKINLDAPDLLGLDEEDDMATIGSG
jgi:hypothetical protein